MYLVSSLKHIEKELILYMNLYIYVSINVFSGLQYLPAGMQGMVEDTELDFLPLVKTLVPLGTLSVVAVTCGVIMYWAYKKNINRTSATNAWFRR